MDSSVVVEYICGRTPDTRLCKGDVKREWQPVTTTRKDPREDCAMRRGRGDMDPSGGENPLLYTND